MVMAQTILTEEEILIKLFNTGDLGSDLEDEVELNIEIDNSHEEEYDLENEVILPAVIADPPQEVSVEPSVTLILDEPPVPSPPSAVPSTPSTSSAAPCEMLSLSEERSRKRRRGELHPEVGGPIKKLDQQVLRAKDKTIWHRDPNPHLPSIVKTSIEKGVPTILTESATSASDIFSLFLDETMLAEVCLYTNDKMNAIREQFSTTYSATFREVNLMEMKAFIGILLFSGIKQDNHVGTEEMWSPVCGCPFYRSVMSERRFSFILRCLRFDDSTTRNVRKQSDRFAHIRKLWDAVIHKCIVNYRPGPHVTVDEQLLAFRGHCIFRIFIPNKPAKYGIKLVMACDADTHYMCNAMPYLGKGTMVDKVKSGTLGEFFTMELIRPFQRSGRVVTTDSWFTSLALARKLKESSMHLVGTIRPKPYIPQEIMHIKMNIGESVAAYNYEDEVTVLCQKANTTKRIQLLSTVHHNPTIVEGKKTQIHMFYDATKGGVDTFDQMCAATSCGRKTRRWPLCLFYGILNIIVNNAFIIYSNKPNNREVTRRQFGMKLAMELSRPWAHYRLTRTGLQRELSAVIQSVFGPVQQLPRQQEEGAIKTEKRHRCHICPHSSIARTKLLCANCKKSTCHRHITTFCSYCIPECKDTARDGETNPPAKYIKVERTNCQDDGCEKAVQDGHELGGEGPLSKEEAEWDELKTEIDIKEEALDDFVDEEENMTLKIKKDEEMTSLEELRPFKV
ncbi:piggyBac transposable element-derived protein 4-like isoform X2 [Macrobrachium rosenbergii]